MLHHATITKSPAQTIAILTGTAGSISAEDADPNKARHALLTKARTEMTFAPTGGERHRYRVELLGETLASGNERAEVLRAAVAAVSRLMMAAQSDTPRRHFSR